MRHRPRRNDFRTDSPGRQSLCRHPQFPFARGLLRRGLPLSDESDRDSHRPRASRPRGPVSRASQPCRLRCRSGFPVRLEWWNSLSMGIGLLPSWGVRNRNSSLFRSFFHPQSFPPLGMESLRNFHTPVDKICGGFFTFDPRQAACRRWACRPAQSVPASRCSASAPRRRRDPPAGPCAWTPSSPPGATAAAPRSR